MSTRVACQSSMLQRGPHRWTEKLVGPRAAIDKQADYDVAAPCTIAASLQTFSSQQADQIIPNANWEPGTQTDRLQRNRQGLKSEPYLKTVHLHQQLTQHPFTHT